MRTGFDHDPVSYTHLDVYKRQVRVMATAPVPQPAGTVDEGYVQHRAVEMGHYALEPLSLIHI